jgi:hypothetical protein
MYVTNKWNRDLVVDYACKELCFPVGKTIEVSEHCVRHIFGYGAENKETYMAQIGIIKTTNDIEDGLRILALFEIRDTPPEKNHSLSPVVDKVPLPLKKGEGKVRSITA